MRAAFVVVVALAGCDGSDAEEREADLVGRWFATYNLGTETYDGDCEPGEQQVTGADAFELDAWETADELVLELSALTTVFHARTLVGAPSDPETVVSYVDSTLYDTGSRIDHVTELALQRDGDVLSGTGTYTSESFDANGTSADRCAVSQSFDAFRIVGGVESNVDSPAGSWLFRWTVDSVATGTTCYEADYTHPGEYAQVVEVSVAGERAALCWGSDCYDGTLDGTMLEAEIRSERTYPETGLVDRFVEIVRLDVSTGIGERETQSWEGTPDDPEPDVDCTSIHAIRASRIVAGPAN